MRSMLTAVEGDLGAVEVELDQIGVSRVAEWQMCGGEGVVVVEAVVMW